MTVHKELSPTNNHVSEPGAEGIQLHLEMTMEQRTRVSQATDP